MNRRATAGVSLVELLVSTTLSMLISIAVATTYVLAKREFHFYQQLARMQETGRYALHLLGRELAMSGFYGGLPAPAHLVVPPPGQGCVDGWSLDAGSALQLVNDFQEGAEDQAGGDVDGPGAMAALLQCVDQEAVYPGTDLIAIKRTASDAALYNGELALGPGVSDTRRWYLRVGAGTVTSWQKLSATELRALETVQGTSYWRAMSSLFFIRPWSVARGDGIPALCAEVLAGSVLGVQCFAEGIEDMQVELALDTDADGVADHYLDSTALESAAAMDFSRAVSARIYLLVRSLEPVYGFRSSASHALGSKVHDSVGDGFVRRVISTTVPLDARMRPLG